MSEKTVDGKGLPAAWRIAAVWAILSILGVLFAMPFLLAMLEGLNAPNRPPLPVMTLALVLQTGILSFFLAWGGTAAGRKLDVGCPFIEAWLAKRTASREKSFGVAALLGALGGLVIIGLDTAFAPFMTPPLRSVPQPTPLQGLLASVYGGISEEVLMRLGATTMFAWLVGKFVGREGRGRTLSLTLGVFFGALLFGVAHLPVGFTIWPPSGIVVARILVLNAVVGLLAGMVYVRRGLEHAVVLHWAADIMLYVLRPILAG